MKKISIILFALLTTVSCSDNIDKGKPAAPHIYPQFKNEFRVTAIEGKNDRWGEFKMKMYYDTNEELDSAWVTDKNGRRIAAITGKVSSTGARTSINEIYDYIQGISQDSVLRMDAKLKEKYGEGNYSLIDSIPRSVRSIKSHYTSFFADGRVSNSKVEYYTPRKNLGTSGIDFNSTYLKTKEEKLIYEYNLEGQITVIRTIADTYEIDFEKNTSTFKNSDILKQVISYDGKNVNRIEDYILLPGENFSIMNDYLFNYTKEGISSISSKEDNRTFSRSGNILTITRGSSVMTYELDGKGYPIKIEDGKGNFMKVTYEKGNGDFQNLTSILDQSMGNPFIR